MQQSESILLVNYILIGLLLSNARFVTNNVMLAYARFVIYCNANTCILSFYWEIWNQNYTFLVVEIQLW